MAWLKRLCLRFAARIQRRRCGPLLMTGFWSHLVAEWQLKRYFMVETRCLSHQLIFSVFFFKARFSAEVINLQGFKELNNLPRVSGWTLRKKKRIETNRDHLGSHCSSPKNKIHSVSSTPYPSTVLLLLLMNRYQVVQWIQVCFCHMSSSSSFISCQKKYTGSFENYPI